MTSENIITDTEPERIEFRQFHQPTLKTGDYSITVEQKAQTVGDGRIPATTFRKQNLFSVASEQFVFNPPLINAVFPPDGNLGDHFNIFPHIILNRSTLPWERTATEKDENVPWLALLLFDAAEAVAPKIMTLAELSKPSQDARVKWRGVKPEAGQNPTDKVTVIEVQKSVLENIMPTAADLAWLAHARQGKNIAGTKSGDELAIIIGNRLPRKGASSTVHLVSVENRYTTGGEFDFQKAAPEDLIRLVSLKSWSFTCADSRQNFKGLLKKLDPFDVAGFDQKRSLLRLPPPENALPEAEKYLSAGAVPLPHFLRQGDRTISWYHGPLVPGENMNQSPVSLPVRAADELLRYNESDGMFDVSYSAAWELGRLLALQNKKAATGIYQWKRQRVQRQKQFAQSPLDDYLPGRSNRAANGDDIKPPADLCGWFEDLSLLKGVPFNYLVPDERMLPGESIRFFQLDKLWIDCLLDGAFSIGRATGADYRFDQAVGEMELPNNPHPKVYGFLLRSEVVAGWSSLLADAYAQTYNSASEKSAKPVKNLRRERLSANVWLCLFEEEFRRIEFHLNPEALNFGLDVPDNSSKDFYKTLKDEQGEPLSDKAGNPVKIEFRNEPAVWRQAASGVVSTGILAALINSALKPFHAAEPFTSAHFALQMIEGIEKVIFEISSEQN